MLDRPRPFTLAWSGVCLALFAGLWLWVGQHPGPLPIDGWARGAEDWADGYPWLVGLLRGIEVAFGTLFMTIYTVVVTLALMAKRHLRAAALVVVASLVTMLITNLIKAAMSRPRPAWQDTVGLMGPLSFPSGHSSGIATLAALLAVIVVMLVRRRSLRRVAYLGLGFVTLLVFADRVLLGRHYPSDVLGGGLLGLGVVLAGVGLYSPLPRSIAATAAPLPEPVPAGRTVAVVLNPIKVEDLATFRQIVGSMAASSGWAEPLWYQTTIEDPGTGMAHDAALAGADLVLVCGGDGTVREVCAELAGTGIPVGIIPAGTGNLLARNLDIPLFLRAAVDVALNGQDRAIDLVEVSGDGFAPTHFMVMAGMGLDAAMMDGVNEEVKKKVGWVAYVISGAKSLMFPAAGVDISLDGGDFTRHRARTVVVGNVGYLQAGMPLLPDAAIDDGLLDVVILHPQRFWSWIPLALRVVARRRRTDELINRMTGRTVTLRAHTDTPRQLDGDTVGPGRELHMECIPGRLLVRVPR